MTDFKIRKFTDLIAWQKAHKLVLIIYRETKHFPSEEKFALIDQLRRCVVSISSNIAEGFSRHSLKEKQQFYAMAHGSLTELQNQLIIARDVGYLPEKKFAEIEECFVEVEKLIVGLIRSSSSYAK